MLLCDDPARAEPTSACSMYRNVPRGLAAVPRGWVDCSTLLSVALACLAWPWYRLKQPPPGRGTGWDCDTGAGG